MTQTGAWVVGLPFKIPFDVEKLVANPIEPKMDLDEAKEEVVGEMSDDEKLIFTIWRSCQREADLAETEARFETEKGKEREASVRHSTMCRMAALFESMLWITLWGHLGTEHSNLGVVRGFKIVTRTQESPILGLLSGLDNKP